MTSTKHVKMMDHDGWLLVVVIDGLLLGLFQAMLDSQNQSTVWPCHGRSGGWGDPGITTVSHLQMSSIRSVISPKGFELQGKKDTTI